MGIQNSIRAFIINNPKDSLKIIGVAPHVNTFDDDPEPVDLSDIEHLDIKGVACGLEYLDSKQNKSTRRVTLSRLAFSKAGNLMLRCWCYEREAWRTFRFDRIQSIFDLDGVIYKPVEYFEDLHGVRLKNWAVSTVSSVSPPGQAQKNHIGTALMVLSALSFADGFTHDAEVDAILDYVKLSCKKAKIETTQSDINAIRQYVARLHPNKLAVLDAIEIIAEDYEGQNLEDFVRAAKNVIMADGIIHPNEILILEQINASLRH